VGQDESDLSRGPSSAREWIGLIPVGLIGIAIGFLALFLWTYGLIFAGAIVVVLGGYYLRLGRPARVGILLAASAGTYALLLGRTFLEGLGDPAIQMPLMSQIAMWASVLTCAFGIALVVTTTRRSP
jgi:hypothetical protein